MSRWVLPILLCVALAVITTVGVAWFFSNTFRDPGQMHAFGWESVETRFSHTWTVEVRRNPGRVWWFSDRLEGTFVWERESPAAPSSILPRWADGHEMTQRFDDARRPSIHRSESIATLGTGWPWPALGCQFSGYSPRVYDIVLFVQPVYGTVDWSQFVAVDETVMDAADWLDSVQSTSSNSFALLLPVRPLWTGFLFDTLFYAVIWFALIFGGRAHMRVIRRWQGHGPMCKYDLRGDLDTGCPECGWGREG